MALTQQAAALKAGHHLRCFERVCWSIEENVVEAYGLEAATAERVQEEATYWLQCEQDSCTCADEVERIEYRQRAQGLEVTGKECKCGCGRPVRKNYLPGHDAKHIAWAVSRILWNDERWEDLVYEFSTPALAQKFTDRLNRARKEHKG